MAYVRPLPGQQFMYTWRFGFYPTTHHHCAWMPDSGSYLVRIDEPRILVYIRPVQCRCQNIHLVLMAGRVLFLRTAPEVFGETRIP